jgi:aminoglycoside phosphotransferase (APT) family kinase protein
MLDLDALCDALSKLPDFAGIARADLTRMNVKGLAHDHVALRGRDQLLRVPKQSQFALSADDNLAYQAACFERVSRAGRAPRLHGVIQPSAEIPMGALLVDHIRGRPPRLPEDLPAFAESMARVHALALPAPAERAPLADHQDPVAGALEEIEGQVLFLKDSAIEPASRREIEAELDWARAFAAEVAAGGEAQPHCLVLTDTHPGNFLIDETGHAIIVDLEKALYGSPGIDLAHATVYSSTTWDSDVWADLDLSQVAAFYHRYLEIITAAAGPAFARALKPWLLPMRRLLFLRAITWCVKWQVLQARERLSDKHAAQSTEDWSADNSDPALIAHVADRVRDYLRPATLKRMRGEWQGPNPLQDRI